MKFTFALLTLFAVVCISQAIPQPEEASAQAAQPAPGAQGEQKPADGKSDAEFLAEVKANPKARLWFELGKFVGGTLKGIFG